MIDELSRSASMFIGRSAPPNAPIAISTRMSGTAASTRASSLAAYLASLRTSRRWRRDANVSSIFFGGGTPSLMAAETVGAVLDRIAELWPIADDVEITLEANPTSVEAGALRRLSRRRRQSRVARRAVARRCEPQSARPPAHAAEALAALASPSAISSASPSI